jgi:hypothetical protein
MGLALIAPVKERIKVKSDISTGNREKNRIVKLKCYMILRQFKGESDFACGIRGYVIGEDRKA